MYNLTPFITGCDGAQKSLEMHLYSKGTHVVHVSG